MLQIFIETQWDAYPIQCKTPFNFKIFKYQAISVGKRKPLLKERLDEARIGFEGQRRHLRKLQQLGVKRRHIRHDFHTHRDTYTDHGTLDSQSKASQSALLLSIRRIMISNFDAFLCARFEVEDAPDLLGIEVIGERENGRENFLERSMHF